jgi:putative Mg2+ transporter-C (MgtC) family protein
MIPPTDVFLRLGAAILLGGAVGFERGRKDHPAGLRTHMLVALASATFMLVSTQFMYFQPFGPHDFRGLDPSRIASGVVMGLGFLGAGSILRTEVGVHGLTTAASLWMVTAVGLAAGAGMYLAAATATGIALFVLTVLHYVEAGRDRKADQCCRLRVDLDDAAGRAAVVEQLRAAGFGVARVGYARDLEARRWRIRLDLRFADESDLDRVLAKLEGQAGVRRIKVRRRQP